MRYAIHAIGLGLSYLWPSTAVAMAQCDSAEQAQAECSCHFAMQALARAGHVEQAWHAADTGADGVNEQCQRQESRFFRESGGES